METEQIRKLAGVLDSATLETREIERLTLTSPQLSLSDAYLIQDCGVTRRIDRGEKFLGYKMGLTSRAKREQMNLNSPIYGVLTDRMMLADKELFHLRGTIHPKIEPEIAFFVGREIRYPITQNEVLAACSGVCAAMEVLDSRYLNFKYFSLPDVVADNCSSAFFVLSSQIKKPNEIDLSNLEMTMSINGKPVQKGMSDAISGHPANSLVHLCEILNDRGLSVPAGSIVLAGAATQAVSLEPGLEVSLKIQNLGDVSILIAKD